MPTVQNPVAVNVEKILLATDFSASSEKAAAYAKALARRFQSTVEIAHIFNPSGRYLLRGSCLSISSAHYAGDQRRCF